MKRIILFLLILSLLAACAPSAASASPQASASVEPASASPMPDTGERIETHTVEIASSPAPTAAPNESVEPSAPAQPSEIPLPTETLSPITSISFTNVGASEVRADPLPLEITTREFDWNKVTPDGDYPVTFRQETIDFSELKLTLESLDADEAHVRLRVRVQYPASWTLLQCQNMNGYDLHVRVLLDEQQVPFTLRAKSVQLGFQTASDRCDDYEIVLESDTVDVHTLAAAEKLTLSPYVLTHALRAEGNRVCNGADGSIVLLSYQNGISGRIDLKDLPERAVTVDLASLCAGVEPKPIPERGPVLHTVTLHDLDVPRLFAEGRYDPNLKDGSVTPEWGVVRNEAIDFSELQIFIDSFTVTDLGVQAIIRVQNPDSWSGKLKWMLYGDTFDFRLYVDEEDYNRTVYKKTGTRLGWCRWTERPHTPSSVEDWESYDRQVEYYAIFASSAHAEGLLNAKEICFVPVVQHDKIYRINRELWDLDKEETPYGDTWKYEIVEFGKEPIYEVAAYVDPASLIVPKEVH